jgi:hypothetical protein
LSVPFNYLPSSCAIQGETGCSMFYFQARILFYVLFPGPILKIRTHSTLQIPSQSLVFALSKQSLKKWNETPSLNALLSTVCSAAVWYINIASSAFHPGCAYDVRFATAEWWCCVYVWFKSNKNLIKESAYSIIKITVYEINGFYTVSVP